MRFLSFLVAAVMSVALVPSGAFAAASVVGAWAGGGNVKLTSGHVEPVRCNIRYEESTGNTFVVYVRCAHANGTFQQSGRIVRRGANSYSGHIYSDQYKVAGAVTIRVSGNRQTITATSDKGTASLTLNRR